jgi:hypothetical protein
MWSFDILKRDKFYQLFIILLPLSLEGRPFVPWVGLVISIFLCSELLFIFILKKIKMALGDMNLTPTSHCPWKREIMFII